MIDKKTEAGIKAVKSFIEFWMKFHHIYKDTISKGIISKEDEDKFLEVKNTIKAKYGDLMSMMEFRYMPHGRLTDPVNAVLGVETIRFISEENLRKVNNDWKDSYVFLNNIQERLKEKRRRMEDLNPVGVFFKRMFNGG